MKVESIIEERIELYLANELSAADRADFENLIAHDGDLRAEVELMRHIAIAFEQRGEAVAFQELAGLDEPELKAIVEKVEKKYEPTIQKLVGLDEPELRAIVEKVEKKYKPTNQELAGLDEQELKAIVEKVEKKYKPTNHELAGLDEPELKAIVEKVERKYEPTNKTRRNLILTLSAAAAVAVIVLSIGLQPRYSSENLYAEFHTIPAYESLPPSRAGSALSAAQERELSIAIEFYNVGNFAQSVNAFAKAGEGVKQEYLSDDMIYYWAISLNEAGDSGQAMQKFEYLSGLSESEFREDAMWQHALVLLKIGKRDQAKAILRNLAGNGGGFSDRASVILEKLNRKKWL